MDRVFTVIAFVVLLGTTLSCVLLFLRARRERALQKNFNDILAAQSSPKEKTEALLSLPVSALTDKTTSERVLKMIGEIEAAEELEELQKDPRFIKSLNEARSGQRGAWPAGF